MHTFRSNETTFHHNNDLSGDVVIERHDKRIMVPAEELVEFVAEHVRRQRIADLERMDFREVLGLPK